MSATRPHRFVPLLTHYWGRAFRRPYAVVGDAEGGLWFSDAGEEGEEGTQMVYRFEAGTGDVRVVADGFEGVRGVCLGEGEGVFYVCDGGRGRATIYAFDVVYARAGGGGEGPFLANRRVFAYVGVGVPDGVRCDGEGNVWAGCGDGVNVWDRGGRLIGKVLVEGGVKGVCWGRDGEMWLSGGERLWRVQLGEGVGGV